MTDRRRNTFVLLIVLGLVIASLLVIVGIPGVVKAKKTRLGLDLKGGVELTYQARPTAHAKVDTESLERAITIMRKRVDALGVAQPEIQRSGSEEIDVALPNVSNAGRAEAQVGKTALLYFYDWEPNVIGPDGKPAPTEASVTGGENAASSTSGLLEYQAVLRAAKRPAIIRKSDTTLSPGCTPEQKEGCIYGSWYLLETQKGKEKVLRGPEETKANLYSEGFKAPKGAELKAVRVNPGTVLVQARPVEGADGKVTQASPNSWYVLNDDPVLEGKDITNPQESSESESGQPDVTFGFDSHGKGVFQQTTKEIARAWPGSAAAGRYQGTGPAALRDRARRPGDHRAVDRLHEVPGRDRRFAGL